jgi:N6-L-threonylcarbamoyladenine synthase
VSVQEFAAVAMPRGVILGIESSCDETAAAVVVRGSETLSSVVASQIAIHSPYGGVVPELASREHLRAIVPVVRAAMAEAKLNFSDLDAIAVTEGPGLAGALMVGLSYAKSLAFAAGKPLIAVNHLEGHIHAVLLDMRERFAADTEVKAGVAPVRESRGRPLLPALALVVSGGHTHLYLARQHGAAWTYSNVGRTVDDAAGEAFDKVAKLLGLGYPGGPWIDALSAFGDPDVVPFTFSQIKAKAHRPGQRAALPRFLFSFSGIKTAVLRYVELHGMRAGIETRRKALALMDRPTPQDTVELCDVQTLDLIASFQRAVVGDLLRKTFRAADELGVESILVSGGVAANRELRTRFTMEAEREGMPIAFPTLALSTDNAAMIAAAAWPKFLSRDFATLELTPDAGLKLGEVKMPAD